MSKKGASKTGGTAGRKRAADSAMAARLKDAGISRSSGRCGICNEMVPLKHMDSHMRVHK